MFLPQSRTTLEQKHGLVVAVSVPGFIAEDRGLVAVECNQEHNDDEQAGMTLEDWYLLGCVMAMAIRGEPDAAWEGEKLARKLLRQQ